MSFCPTRRISFYKFFWQKLKKSNEKTKQNQQEYEKFKQTKKRQQEEWTRGHFHYGNLTKFALWSSSASF